MHRATPWIIFFFFAVTTLLAIYSYRHMAKFHPTLRQSDSLKPVAIKSLATGTLQPLLADDGNKEMSTQRLHVIILVHGWVGCPQDLGYLHHALEEQARQLVEQENNGDSFYVYTCTSNHGRTNDGIQAGADRIAAEIEEYLQGIRDQNKDVQELSLSIVGFSLGGMYARYALPKILASADNLQLPKIVPKVFCTIATPHLGTSQGHTWFPFPKVMEKMISLVTQTGRDLFHHTPLIQNTVTDFHWIEPLLRFQKRIAYANTYAMDLMVPTSTAAFLSERSDSEHFHPSTSQRNYDSDNPFVALVVETPANHDLLKQSSLQDLEMAEKLDAMGWTKVFVDFTDGYQESPKSSYTSSALHSEFNRSKKKLFLPVGHDLVVVNSKNVISSFAMRRGRPLVDQIAKDLVHDTVFGPNATDESKGTCKSA